MMLHFRAADHKGLLQWTSPLESNLISFFRRVPSRQNGVYNTVRSIYLPCFVLLGARTF